MSVRDHAATKDDIRQFREAVAGFLGTNNSDLPPAPDASWRMQWSALADLGITSLCVAEAHGGLGDQVEVAIATARELGAALHGSPYAGLITASHALSRASGAGAGVSEVVAGIASGDVICAFGRSDVRSGTAHFVDGVPGAHALLLSDTGDGTLLLLDDPTAWVASACGSMFDVSRSCSDLTFDPASGQSLAPQPGSTQMFGLLLAADALGGAERSLARMVSYASDRLAFGKAIGGFQAVQHRLADHAVRLRGMAILIDEAALALSAGDPSASRRILVAEASVSGGVTHILHDLLQLTGAIGFTWEYGLHYFERRAHVDALLASNPRRATQALAAQEGWLDAI